MTDNGIFLATVKAHEALSKLAAASRAVETLTLIEGCPEARQELSGILSGLHAHTRALEGYTARLKERS